LGWGISYGIYQNLLKNVMPVEARVVSQPIPTEVWELTDYYADLYGIDKALFRYMVQCESQGELNRIGDTDYYVNGVWTPSYGVLQFQKRTFNEYAKKYGVKNAKITDYRSQLLIAAQMVRDNKTHLWTCGRRYYENKKI
jgi:hypothetical protein